MSGRKNFLPMHQIITSGDMSAASITSAVTNIQFIDNVAIELVWSGSPVGSFAVQGSVDYNQDQNGNVTNTGTWIALTFSSAVTASGSAGNALYDLNQLSFPWIRVVYTKTSGTGTLQGYVAGKML